MLAAVRSQSVFERRAEAIRRAYAAFSRRDLDGALELLAPDVEWPDVLGGTTVHGRDAVRRYWEEQQFGIESRVEPMSFVEAGDSVAVRVRQHVRALPDGDEEELTVVHLLAFEGEGEGDGDGDGDRVTAMRVYYSLDEALDAAAAS